MSERHRRGRPRGHGRRSGGRAARQAMRAAARTHADAFLTRTMKPVEIVSDEGLEIIMHNAETILAEVGIEVRGYPSAVVRFRDAGCDVDGERVRFPRGLARTLAATAPATLRPARQEPGARRDDRRRRHGVRTQLRLAVRPRPRRRPPLRDARRLPELRQADVLVAAPAPLRRHGVRAGRHPGEQAPPRHGVQPPALQRQGDHGLGHGRRAGRRHRRAGPDRLRRRPRRPHGAHQPDQRLVAARVGRHDARRRRGLRRRQPGDDHHAVHPRRGDGARSPSPVSPPRRSPRRWPGSRSRSSSGPGAPVVLGSFASSMSMQTGAPTFGTPEPALVLYTLAALARRLGLPFRSGGSLCASKLPDAQAAYESASTLLPTIMAGVNFVLHAAGWLEGGSGDRLREVHPRRGPARHDGRLRQGRRPVRQRPGARRHPRQPTRAALPRVGAHAGQLRARLLPQHRRRTTRASSSGPRTAPSTPRSGPIASGSSVSPTTRHRRSMRRSTRSCRPTSPGARPSFPTSSPEG